MIIKMEIDNGIQPKIIIENSYTGISTYISNEGKDTRIVISNESLYSIITSLCIMYRELTHKDYPNK